MPYDDMEPSDNEGASQDEEELQPPDQDEENGSGSDSEDVPEITKESEDADAVASADPDGGRAQKRSHSPEPVKPVKRRQRAKPPLREHAADGSSDDEIHYPKDMQRQPVTVPEDEQEGPVDVVKAAEAARKAGAAVAASAMHGHNNSGGAHHGGGGNGGAPPIQSTVDPAIHKLTLLQTTHKASAVGVLPMESCVHGIIMDNDGHQFPPYEVTWEECRLSGAKRKAWLDARLAEDPTRVYQTLIILDVDGASNESSESSGRKKTFKYQACLPGKLTPSLDRKATTGQKVKYIGEALGGEEWTMAIVLPADAVAQLYKTTNCGLPTALDPNTVADATYGVIEKMELQVQKDPRIRIISVIPDGSASGNKGRGAGGAAGAPAAATAAAPSGAGGAAAAARKPESKRRSATDAGPQRVITDFATVRTREPDPPPEDTQAAEEAAKDPVAAPAAAHGASPACKSTTAVPLGPMLDLDWASLEVHGQRHHIGMTVEGRRLVSASMCGNQLTVVTEPEA